MLLEIKFFIKKEKEEEKKIKSNQIKIALSLGYHHSYFYNKRCNIIMRCFLMAIIFLIKNGFAHKIIIIIIIINTTDDNNNL